MNKFFLYVVFLVEVVLFWFFVLIFFYKKKIDFGLLCSFLFLLVDSVMEYMVGEFVVVIKNVIINDNFFFGYFFESFIMFGVFMVEVIILLYVFFFL